jgi:hypothetical protein
MGLFGKIKSALTAAGETKMAQRVLDEAFEHAGFERNYFMKLHPAIHGTLLRLYLMSGDLEGTIRFFHKAAEEYSNPIELIRGFEKLRQSIEVTFQNWQRAPIPEIREEISNIARQMLADAS